jgi:hypothetical protein
MMLAAGNPINEIVAQAQRQAQQALAAAKAKQAAADAAQSTALAPTTDRTSLYVLGAVAVGAAVLLLRRKRT